MAASAVAAAVIPSGSTSDPTVDLKTAPAATAKVQVPAPAPTVDVKTAPDVAGKVGEITPVGSNVTAKKWEYYSLYDLSANAPNFDEGDDDSSTPIRLHNQFVNHLDRYGVGWSKVSIVSGYKYLPPTVVIPSQSEWEKDTKAKDIQQSPGLYLSPLIKCSGIRIGWTNMSLDDTEIYSSHVEVKVYDRMDSREAPIKCDRSYTTKAHKVVYEVTPTDPTKCIARVEFMRCKDKSFSIDSVEFLV
jgi:hypothetical protein